MSSSDLDQLQAVLRTTKSAASPEIKRLLSRVSEELGRRAKSSDSLEFILGASRAFCRVQGTAHAEIRQRCLKECATYLFVAGRIKDALEATDGLRAIAHASGDIRMARVADTLAGIIFADCGDIAAAVTYHCSSLEMAEKIGDIEGQISTLINLGAALNNAGLYSDAIPCFLRAQHLCDPTNHAHLVIEPSAYSNLAQSYLFLGRKEQAQRAIKKAKSLTREPRTTQDSYNRVIRERTFVEIALEMGDREGAREGLEECLRFANSYGNVKAIFFAAIAEGSYKAKYESLDQGIALLQRALDSPAAEWAACRCVALKALVRVYDEGQRSADALDVLRELLSSTRRLRQQGLSALNQTALGFGPIASQSELIDLQLWANKEAELRARVAEGETALASDELMQRLAISADLREESSGAHGYRVGALSAELGKSLGMNVDDACALENAARLHDIGKIGVPERILLSPATLVEAERQFICAHTSIGSELLANSRSPTVRLAEAIARCHHEWWNGEGYPSRLAGKRIPLEARIVALADVFDALTHGRPFSPPWPVDRALAEIRSRRGTQFDPELTDVFLALMERLLNEHEDLDAHLGKASRHSPFLQARNRIRKMLEDERENEKQATVAGSATRH